MKSQVTTKRGDDGDTKALSGERLSKSHPIMDCVGGVDELRAHTALVRLRIIEQEPREHKRIADFLFWLLHTYFMIGTACSDPEKRKPEFHRRTITEGNLRHLEDEQNWMENDIELSKKFVVSASSTLSAKVDVTVTVVRRLERSIALLGETNPGFQNANLLAFVNRLSDYFYILARFLEDGKYITIDYTVVDKDD